MLTKKLATELLARHWGEEARVSSIKSLDLACENSLSVFLSPRDLKKAKSTKAAALVISELDAADFADMLPTTLIVTDKLYESLKRCIVLLSDTHQNNLKSGIHKTAVIHSYAQIHPTAVVFPQTYIGKASVGKNTIIRPFVYIDDNVIIGEDCIIEPGCTILANTTIENRVHLKAGSVIGSDGFVHFVKDGHNIKMPMNAGVIIADDVEVGANTCIDKGFLQNTHVHENTKIDNLIQIAHDVSIGKSSVLAGQSGVAGYSQIGENVSIGGQAGVGPNRKIKNNAQVSAASAVFKDVNEYEVVSGVPAIAHLDFLRASASQKKLHLYQKEVRELKKRLKKLEDILAHAD